MIANLGNATDAKTGRKFFLDYPCDLKPRGESDLRAELAWRRLHRQLAAPILSEQKKPNAIWGLKARPGTAEVFVYPGCEKGRVVADIIRNDKGHTEGLEPNVTEQIVKLMLSVRMP